MKKKILCTLGPQSLKPYFLKNIKNKVSLLRLNLSHIDIKSLKKKILYIRKYTSIPICIDTEGAQIRTKVKKKILFKKNKKYFIGSSSNFNLYPFYVTKKLKKNDILDVGFDGLKIKILKKNKKQFIFYSSKYW